MKQAGKNSSDSLSFVEESPGGLKISVRVQPRASRNEIGDVREGALRVKLTAPPVDGSANKQLIAFLSKKWDVPKSRMEILSGEASRQKRILLRGVPISHLKGHFT